MVIVNGENLYPAEIEGVTPHLTGISDAVVATLPHPVTGVELVLVYTLLPGAEADEDGWRAELLKHLSTFKVPRRFVPLTELGTDAFPRTGLGKIVRPDVRRLALEHLQPRPDATPFGPVIGAVRHAALAREHCSARSVPRFAKESLVPVRADNAFLRKGRRDRLPVLT